MTSTLIPGEAKVLAEPVARIGLRQLLSLKMVTVEPVSAVPLTFGALWFAGEAGDVARNVGGAGANVSFTKVVLAAAPQLL